MYIKALRLCYFLLLITSSGYTSAANLDIGVVISNEHALTKKLHQRLQILSQSHHRKLHVVPMENISDFTGIGLYVAIGATATDALLKHQPATGDILTVHVSRTSYHEVLQRHQIRINDKRLHVVYSDPIPAIQLVLIKHLLPGRTDTAVILSDATRFFESSLRRMANDLNINLSVISHENQTNVFSTMRRIPNHASLLIIPDPAIYNSKTLHNIIASSYRNHRFIFGYSKKLVEAGGLASITFTDNEISQLIENQVQHIISGKSTKMSLSRPANFDIAVNESVARSFSLKLPPLEDVRRSINVLWESCCDEE